MTRKLYLLNPKTNSCSATILSIDRENNHVCVDQTIFHPQGGGQMSDTGTLGPANVIKAVQNDDGVWHHVDNINGLKEGQVCSLAINAEKRFLYSRYHTAGHLVASVVEALYPNLHAISGHQWPGESRVDFEGDTATQKVVADDINARLLEDLQSNLAVTLEGDPFLDRSIKIGKHNSIPCGGTHVASLNELGSVMVRSIKIKGSRVRIGYEIS
jgi:alanyl-tRNA synthetase